MQTEIRIIDGQVVVVTCEHCPVCGEYAERRTDIEDYIMGRDCGH